MTGGMVFAISMKKWIEFRKGEKPPKKKLSESLSEVTVKVRDYSNYRDWGNPGWKDEPRKLKVTCVTYQGGRVVGTMKARRFYNLTGVKIKDGCMLELPAELASVVLDSGKSKEKGVRGV